MMRFRHLQATREEGASATLFILSLFVFLAIAMLAVDGGNLLRSRQGQIADTDSAALAIAQSLIDDPCANSPQPAMDAVAAQYIEWNDPDEFDDSSVFDVEGPSGACPSDGEVTVDTVRRPPLFFAPIFGFGDTPTGVSSTVEYGQVSEFYGMAPIGICEVDGHYNNEWLPYYRSVHFDGAFVGWDAAKLLTEAEYAVSYPDVDAHPDAATGDGPWAGTTYPAGIHVHRVTFASPDAGYDCGDTPGTFGWLDFDGNGFSDIIDHRDDCDGYTPQDELNCDLGTGHDGPISISPPDCRPHDDLVSRCEAEPGGVAAAKDALEDLTGACAVTVPAEDPSCRPIYIVVYGDDVGAGEDGYRIESVAGIVIRDYKLTGAVADRYIDFEFVDQLVDGEVGPSSPSSTAPFTMKQCAVDGFENCG